MRLETFQRLVSWLPKLSALEDARRLAVLSQIDRILAAEAITWDDLAMHLMPPALPPGDVAMMVSTIMHWGENPDDHTINFLAQLRERAQTAKGSPIYLTERQSGWLWSIYRKALNQRTRQQKQQPVTSGETNVVQLVKRVTA